MFPRGAVKSLKVSFRLIVLAVTGALMRFFGSDSAASAFGLDEGIGLKDECASLGC